MPALDAERWRQRSLLAQADARTRDPVVQQLVLAADQFIVRRDVDGQAGKTVIAGYHWFNDWGRDTMISLPGLTLSTGRAQDAAVILRTFARYVDQGMLPNNSPTAPARCLATTPSTPRCGTCWPSPPTSAPPAMPAWSTSCCRCLRSIVEWHVRGTRYGIGVDPADGLLRAGEPGVQLTWMDARVGDWVVTPRIGKPVEIQALWYNALRSIAALLRARARCDRWRLRRPAPTASAPVSARASSETISATWRTSWTARMATNCTLRPNQIFAVSLPYPLLDGARAAQRRRCRRARAADGQRAALAQSRTIRPIAATMAAIRCGATAAITRARSGPGCSAPYAEAHYRVHGDRAAALDVAPASRAPSA